MIINYILLPVIIVVLAGVISLFILARKVKSKIKSRLIYFLSLVLLSFFLKYFFLDIRAINSSSMEDTIKVGDKLLVSKLSYGPRFLFGGDKMSRENSYRFRGLEKVIRGDVVVFDHPSKDREYIKRCTGMPGDTLFLIDGVLRQKTYEKVNPELSRHYYVLKINELKAFHMFLSKHELSPFDYAVNKLDNTIRVSLNTHQFLELSKSVYVENIFLDSQNDIDLLNREDALIIPYKGMMLTSNMSHLDYYLQLINTFEAANLDLERTVGYQFKSNYYYFLGDNGPISSDSRSFGLVPDHAIIGKSRMILFSLGKKGMDWKRLFLFFK